MLIGNFTKKPETSGSVVHARSGFCILWHFFEIWYLLCNNFEYALLEVHYSIFLIKYPYHLIFEIFRGRERLFKKLIEH